MPRKRKPRRVDPDKLSHGVEEVMMNPLFNIDALPDIIEFYVHKQAAKTVLEAIDALPPITLYGHRIRVIVEPLTNP